MRVENPAGAEYIRSLIRLILAHAPRYGRNLELAVVATPPKLYKRRPLFLLFLYLRCQAHSDHCKWHLPTWVGPTGNLSFIYAARLMMNDCSAVLLCPTFQGNGPLYRTCYTFFSRWVICLADRLRRPQHGCVLLSPLSPDWAFCLRHKQSKHQLVEKIPNHH